MKYGIITIDDTRKEFKDRIRRLMHSSEEVELDCFDARGTTEPLDKLVEPLGLALEAEYGFKRGEIGGWISHYNSWMKAASMDEPLMVFEDDAILPDHFEDNVKEFMEHVPHDYDFVAFCIPEDQKPDYMWINMYNGRGEPKIIGRFDNEKESQHYIGDGPVARAYSGYGHTAMLFSPKGAKRLVELAKKYTVYTPADCFILNMSHCREVNGYAPKPEFADKFAQFNHGVTSIVQSI